MGYKCEICNEIVENNQPSFKVVTKIRTDCNYVTDNKTYCKTECKDNKKCKKTGWEIAEEKKACYNCYLKNKNI